MDKTIYENLIPSKNYVKTRFMDYLRAVLNPGVETSVMLEALDDAFEIDNASGNQLDVIGELVGLKRLLTYVPSTGTRVMDDDEYRAMLKIKIGRNMWDGSDKAAWDIYNAMRFDDATLAYVDNQDMTVSLHIDGNVAQRLGEIIHSTDGLVVPAGVGRNIIIHDTETFYDHDVYVGFAIQSTQTLEMPPVDDISEVEQPDLSEEDFIYDGYEEPLMDGFGIAMTY